MINYENIEVANLYTEGFEVTFPSSMTIAVGPGLVTIANGDVHEVKTYPEIEFDVEPDDELLVVYDVYLLEENNENGLNAHVDRTEMGIMEIPMYQGTVPLLHCIMSLQVAPDTTALSDLDITVRTIKLTAREDATDEVQSE